MGYGSVESQGYVSIYGDTMKGPIDMGGYAITGLPEATEDTQPVRLAEFNNYISSAISKMAYGSYNGKVPSSGPTQYRTINIGFTPKIVIFARHNRAMYYNNVSYGGIVTQDSPLMYSQSGRQYTVCNIVENGFRVTNLGNTTDFKYNYIAFA